MLRSMLFSFFKFYKFFSHALLPARVCKQHTDNTLFVDDDTIVKDKIEKELHPKYLIMALTSLANAQAEGGQTAEARATYNQLILLTQKALPDTVEQIAALKYAANFFLAEGDLDPAQDLAQEILRIDALNRPCTTEKSRESTAFAHFVLGQVAHKRGDLQLALEFIEESWKEYRNLFTPKDVRSLDVVHALARVNFELGHFERARILTEAVGSTFVDHIKVRHPSETPILGRYHDRLGQLEELHKKIVANLPGVEGPQKFPPQWSTRTGIKELKKEKL